MKEVPHPPKWINPLLERVCKPELLEEIEGDLLEYYYLWVERYGTAKANRLYVIHTLKFLRPFALKKSRSKTTNHFAMFRNYLKTAYRSMARNRLFTTINVMGLAVSMSVGLMMIAFVWDLRSYDNFHENKDRIYRVNTINHPDNGPIMTLASSSAKAGYKIRESISGIDDLTIIRRNFGGDAQIGEKKVPLQGLWADHSFLKVFTFPLLQGDPATALKEPYSLVLTEKGAERLFGETDVLGETVRFDTLDYMVTGIMKDTPKFSHLQFEALVSFSTFELQGSESDHDFFGWKSFYNNYTYLLLSENMTLQTLQANLDRLSEVENAAIENQEINLSIQPLHQIFVGHSLVNEIGPRISIVAIWVLIGLTVIVILSACFNYTNLSIARSMRRSREVGIRKVIGAQRRQVIGQFVAESVLISLFAFVFSFLLFLTLREQFVSIHPFIAHLVSLELSGTLIIYFVTLAVLIGLMAGIFPALFFSRIKALQVLKGVSSLRLFQRINMRKSLIVIQYTFSLIFITSTVIVYAQYKNFVSFDLGFSTENILNIKLQGNKAELLIKELSALPAVSKISQSQLISSLGVGNSAQLKYRDPNDSSSVWKNVVDEHYLPMHGHKFLAGKNFTHKSEHTQQDEVIVNEQLIKQFGIGSLDPDHAIGEIVTLNGKKVTIIGVLKDFHYQTPQHAITPVAILNSANPGRYLNLKISTNDLPATLSSIEHIWKQIDDVHLLDAQFYDDQLAYTFSWLLMIIKVIGFIAFLAVCISSLGLFGMVVFTTETKLKEISIRKVLGAGERNLVYLLSKSYVTLLFVSALIALPVTYFFFDKIILTYFAYHQSIHLVELLAGLLGVLVIALIMIGSQTFSAARSNPAQTLRDE
ncbi:ABC transporter permease [Fulvivirgaceae bacterium BMA10]|uniref:ABC transporter permease n=1 Tax=Splendidivirga corallicola TaxID=3051826 RepID=A0ABT8KKB0_9BACT|nr:ABC transporter permease [Fulvivirgaceae bacterium BMA10]